MMVYVRDCIIEVKNGIARVRSESAVYCPDCGMKLLFHGTCKRKVREQEKTRCYVLRVLFCKSCKRTHRELPDFIVGYKRYSRDELCEIVMNEESYSCEDSMTVISVLAQDERFNTTGNIDEAFRTEDGELDLERLFGYKLGENGCFGAGKDCAAK